MEINIPLTSDQIMAVACIGFPIMLIIGILGHDNTSVLHGLLVVGGFIGSLFSYILTLFELYSQGRLPTISIRHK